LDLMVTNSFGNYDAWDLDRLLAVEYVGILVKWAWWTLLSNLDLQSKCHIMPARIPHLQNNVTGDSPFVFDLHVGNIKLGRIAEVDFASFFSGPKIRYGTNPMFILSDHSFSSSLLYTFLILRSHFTVFLRRTRRTCWNSIGKLDTWDADSFQII